MQTRGMWCRTQSWSPILQYLLGMLMDPLGLGTGRIMLCPVLRVSGGILMCDWRTEP